MQQFEPGQNSAALEARRQGGADVQHRQDQRCVAGLDGDEVGRGAHPTISVRAGRASGATAASTAPGRRDRPPRRCRGRRSDRRRAPAPRRGSRRGPARAPARRRRGRGSPALRRRQVRSPARWRRCAPCDGADRRPHRLCAGGQHPQLKAEYGTRLFGYSEYRMAAGTARGGRNALSADPGAEGAAYPAQHRRHRNGAAFTLAGAAVAVAVLLPGRKEIEISAPPAKGSAVDNNDTKGVKVT